MPKSAGGSRDSTTWDSKYFSHIRAHTNSCSDVNSTLVRRSEKYPSPFGEVNYGCPLCNSNLFKLAKIISEDYILAHSLRNRILSLIHCFHRSPAQVGCMRQVLGPGALGRPRGIGWRGRWEGGWGWGMHVTPWLIHVNVWQNPLKCCEVISLQLIKINEKKRRKKEK